MSGLPPNPTFDIADSNISLSSTAVRLRKMESEFYLVESLMKIGLMTVLILACSSLVYGQDDNTVVPDRPSFSTGSHIVPAGRIQIEGGANRRRFGDTSGYEIGDLLVRAGLFSRVEFRAGLPTYIETHDTQSRESGWSDTTIEGKILLKSGDKGAVSLMPSLILPTGTRSVAEHVFQPGGTLISDVNISKKIVVTSNFGYFWLSSDAQRYNLTFAVSTLNYAPARSVSIYSEFYVLNRQHGWLQRYAATGIQWTAKKRIAFDLSAGFGLSNHAHGPDRYFSIGVSRLFLF